MEMIRRLMWSVWEASKSYLFLGWMGFLVLLSIYFYLERGVFLDAAFVLVEILREEQLAIMVGRYGAALTQIWPLLGMKMGLGLKGLVFIYSVSFAILPFLVAYILHRMKCTSLLLFLGCYYTFYYTESFFWTNNEIHQAVCIFLLAVGLFYKEVESFKFGIRFWVGMVLASVSIMTHPLMLIIVTYVLLLVWLTGIFKPNLKYGYLLTTMVIIVMLAKVYLSTLNWYDAQKFAFVELGLKGDLVWFGSNFTAFFSDSVFLYWPASLVFISGLVLNRQHVWVNFISFLAIIGHVLLVSWAVHEFNRFYIESQWMLISFFVLTPWTVSLFKFKVLPPILHFLLFIAMITTGWNIIRVSNDYSQRVSWITQQVEMMKEAEQDRGIIDLSLEEIRLLRMSWGLPAETLLLSSLDSYGYSVTLIDRTFFTKSVNTDQIHNCFDTISIHRLPKQYFKIQEGSYIPKWQ